MREEGLRRKAVKIRSVPNVLEKDFGIRADSAVK